MAGLALSGLASGVDTNSIVDQLIALDAGRHLGEARLSRDPEMIDKVSELLSELRDGWAQVAAA